MSKAHDEPKVFVALDVDSAREAEKIAENLSSTGVGFKLGPRLMLREGSALVRAISQYGSVFIDCKHLDIPSTMESAIRAGFESGAHYSTIHAWAGPEALTRLAQIEAELNQERFFRILVVTILTSFSSETLPFGLRGKKISDLVEGLSRDAAVSDKMETAPALKSFVCSPHEALALRTAIPEAFLVTPGIRPAGSSKGDQVRIETPAAAAKSGASALVVGRPILEASDQRAMAVQIVKEFTDAKR